MKKAIFSLAVSIIGCVYVSVESRSVGWLVVFLLTSLVNILLIQWKWSRLTKGE